MSIRRALIATSLPLLLITACGRDDSAAVRGDAPAQAAQQGAPQDVFWNNLRSLCGNAYAGSITESSASDTVFAGRDLVMHVRQCEDSEIHIPFHVGEDRSRTWILTRTAEGLRLKHDHRHRDGTADEITQYGGDTRDAGTDQRQEFHADAHTSSLIPAAATNVWTVEVVPGRTFTYALRREGTDRRFRVDFDLTRTVPPPPPAWGHEETPAPVPGADTAATGRQSASPSTGGTPPPR